MTVIGYKGCHSVKDNFMTILIVVVGLIILALIAIVVVLALMMAVVEKIDK
ncbi:hypothetical protein Cal6303_3398 [Calothrix sp. PCC 6303]|nr:hypothetical protein Cal6303_3398 [Calothrix sp. PCC 6303]